MKDKKEIENRIEEILNDERMSYKTATIHENAPLALIQLKLMTELHTLEKVIEEPLTNMAELRGED